MAECSANECLQETANLVEHLDLLSNAQHECKFHPEIKEEACEQFQGLLNDVGKREKALTRACECKKLKGVV